MLATASSERRGASEDIATPDQVPLYDLVPVRGLQGEVLDAYRGVQRADTGEVVSVVSSRYGLVGHREVALAAHQLGAALEAPEAGALAPSFPRESIRLYSGGRRMEVNIVVGRKFGLVRGKEGVRALPRRPVSSGLSASEGLSRFPPADAEGREENVVEWLYPRLRILNSLDGSWAPRLSGFSVRLGGTLNLWARKFPVESSGPERDYRCIYRGTGWEVGRIRYDHGKNVHLYLLRLASSDGPGQDGVGHDAAGVLSRASSPSDC